VHLFHYSSLARKMKSSLTFQILLHLGSYYFGAFVLTEVLLLLYKFIGKLSCSNYSLDFSVVITIIALLFSVLPFPSGTLFAELVLLLFLVLLESVRIFTGWKANLTENVGGMGLCVALFVPGILGVLYFLVWQVRNNLELMQSESNL
jgi:hypothetical protein